MNYVASLSPSEIRQHVAQSQKLWGDGTAEEARYEIQLRRLGEFGPETFAMSGMTDSGGTLVSSCKRYYFPIAWRGETLRAVGLGAVFTNPDFRGQGHARAMIERVVAESAEVKGCRASLLYSNIGTAYYESMEYRAIPALNWHVEVADLPTSDALPVREIPSGDLDPAMRWHAGFTRRFPLAQKRELASYKLLREFNGLERELELLTDDGEPIGLISIKVNRQSGSMYLADDSLWLYDWLVPKEAESRAWATIGRLAREERVPVVSGWRTSYQTLPATAESVPRELAVPMIRSLHPQVEFSDSDRESSFFTSVDHF